MRASQQSDGHKKVLEKLIASARRLRIDLDLNKPIDMFELNAKLSASSNLSERFAIKRYLYDLGCIEA
jgi:hypothetical protein